LQHRFILADLGINVTLVGSIIQADVPTYLRTLVVTVINIWSPKFTKHLYQLTEHYFPKDNSSR